jgi:PPOX class probable F420-dependent enzyme
LVPPPPIIVNPRRTEGNAMMTETQRRFLDLVRVAHLATVGPDAAPHLVPVCFCLDHNTLYITVDEKPKRAGTHLKRIRNIQQNPTVAVTVERWDEDWTRLAWIMLRGRADILPDGEEHDAAQQFLRLRYPQYHAMNLSPLPVIAVRIQRVLAWGALDG